MMMMMMVMVMMMMMMMMTKVHYFVPFCWHANYVDENG
jgi:hypothetical protein